MAERETMVGWHANRLHYIGAESVARHRPTYCSSLCGTVYGLPIEVDRDRRKGCEIDYARLPFCKLCERVARP